MPTADRRRAWGRGPTILRFEPLEGRELLSTAAAAAPDIVAVDFNTVHNLDWGDTFHAVGTLQNRGNADATSPFLVDVYAYGSTATGTDAVKIGSITIPAGLQAGASTGFDQLLRLPPTAVGGMDATETVYVTLKVDPTDALNESRTDDKSGLGQGIDSSMVGIVPREPAQLVGAGLAITTASPTWGGALGVSAQVSNNSGTGAPATRAAIVLTPASGGAGVTVGSLAIPAIPEGQSVQVSDAITLPASAPSALAGTSSYTLTMIEDADGLADPVFPHLANQGAGLDSAPIQIGDNPVTQPAAGPLPDLVAASVQGPIALAWGQTAQVSAVVNNAGNGDAGPVKVRFLVGDADGSAADALDLGDVTIPAIAAHTSQPFTESIALPGRAPDNLGLPAGASLRIIMQVNPENAVDETNASNNVANSDPVSLSLFSPYAPVVVAPASPPPPTLGTPTAIVTPAPATPTPTAIVPTTATLKPVTKATKTTAEFAHAAQVRAQLLVARASRVARREAIALQHAITLKLRHDAKNLRISPKTPA